jgi:hypothetical protein
MSKNLELVSEEQIIKIKSFKIKSETTDLDYKEVLL